MRLKESIAKFLARLGVSADFLTWLGLGLAFYSAWLILHDSLMAAGCVLLFSGLCDLLDGAVARERKQASVFGGILDSSLDRYGDGAVLGAILLRAAQLTETRDALLALSALIGSFAISYVRARAECEMDDCRVGFWERGERLVLIAAALLFDRLPGALWILGLGTHWTVFQRLAYAKFQTKHSSKQTPFYLRVSSRNSRAYYFKVAGVLALLFFLA